MKRRADQLLVERGLAPTRAKAQALLLAGEVHSGDRRIDKPGTLLPEDTPLSVRQKSRFVSRGGDKLDGALDALAIDVSAKTAVDIGASTGGFTDCLLQRGARKVYAVDVGHGQLADRLRNDERVVVRERENARFLRASNFEEPIDLVVVDASFIGIDKLLPAIAAILPPGGELVALIKPQFEVGREEATKSRGVIRDESVRSAAIERAIDVVCAHGFLLIGDCESPLPGPKGNREHFVYARRDSSSKASASKS